MDSSIVKTSAFDVVDLNLNKHVNSTLIYHEINSATQLSEFIMRQNLLLSCSDHVHLILSSFQLLIQVGFLFL